MIVFTFLIHLFDLSFSGNSITDAGAEKIHSFVTRNSNIKTVRCVSECHNVAQSYLNLINYKMCVNFYLFFIIKEHVHSLMHSSYHTSHPEMYTTKFKQSFRIKSFLVVNKIC